MKGRGQARGFTLTELMVVVAIVAVLAVLAVWGVNKYVRSSKATEAIQMIGSIKTAQEAFREETGVYLNVSDNGPYPAAGVNQKHHWGMPTHADYARWQTLGVSTPNPVIFGYITNAGGPTDTVPDMGTLQQTLTFTPNGEPWYVVKAECDRNGNSLKAIFVGSSFTQEVYGENEEE
jgi:type IV pilus assembly protein PilA